LSGTCEHCGGGLNMSGLLMPSVVSTTSRLYMIPPLLGLAGENTT